MNRIPKGNWPLYCAWMIVLTVILGISFVSKLESTSFPGIAETREIIVSSESAVDIRRINVTEGQTVEKGALLVELSSPELVMKINNIEHQIDELKARKGVDKTEVLSRIRQLQAEKTAKENAISSQIAELENQYNINKGLMSDLKSSPDSSAKKADNEESPVRLRIRNLKKDLELSVRPIDVQIELFRKTLDNSDAPIEIQVERLEKDLELVRKENSRLNIYAQISGVIGSVNFKQGEKVSPFASIMTLHAKTPSFIKGYIYENSNSQIEMGDNVDVASLSGTGEIINGEVVGIGARIVEYPVRLRKHPDFQVWGREVMIRIPETNHLILGEKVAIEARQKTSIIAEAIGAVFSPEGSRAEAYDKGKSSSLKNDFFNISKKGVEASGIMYLPDLQQYLVISDDTPDDAPVLYLVDSKGKVKDEVFIEGADQVADLESITEGENGEIYIASSMSPNKKGNVKEKRSILMQVMREGNDFSLVSQADLYSGMKACAEQNSGKDWADFILDAISAGSMDIEAMFQKKGALFLGFKSPFLNEQSVIIRIADIESFLSSGVLSGEQVSIWKKIKLICEEGDAQEKISDFNYVGDTLYITGTYENDSEGRSGSLWKLDEATGTVARLMIFNGRAPEGVCQSGDRNELAICFDGGGKDHSEMVLAVWPWDSELQ